MGLGSKLKGAWRKVEKESKRAVNKAAGALPGSLGGRAIGAALNAFLPGAGLLADSFFGTNGLSNAGGAVGGAAGYDTGYENLERMGKAMIDRAMGKQPEVADPSWVDTQGTASNEGVAMDPNDERRKRAAASYSLSRTRAVRTGRVLGGNLGGAGTGGGSSAKTGGSV